MHFAIKNQFNCLNNVNFIAFFIKESNDSQVIPQDHESTSQIELFISEISDSATTPLLVFSLCIT